MQNILDYFNSILSFIFGDAITLVSPNRVLSWIGSAAGSSSSIESFILELFYNFQFFFSFFVWFWFACLTVHLLLIWPYKWLRKVISK